LQSCINAATSGDTITVSQTGSVAWGGTLTINKSIHIHGPGKALLTCTTGALLFAPTVAECKKVLEFEGFSLTNSAGMFYCDPPGTSYPANEVTGIKLHDCGFSGGGDFADPTPGCSGVVYNCTFSGGNKQIDESSNGNESLGWNWPYAAGSEHFLYFEDNVFSGSVGSFTVEAGQGGRIAFRYNVVNVANGSNNVWDAHGPNNYTGGHGTVISEYYGNSGSTSILLFNHRGGQAIVANNTLSGSLELFGQSWDPASAAAWTGDEIIHDTYYWNNPSGNPDNSNWPSRAILGTHYWCPSYGLEANRPTSPSVGQTYGTIDSVADHTKPLKVWRCRSAGTWTLEYTSYAYPHPLRGSASTPPVGTPVLSVR
jgi:hypothetical protein